MVVNNASVQYNGGFLPDIVLYCWPNATNIGEPVQIPSRIFILIIAPPNCLA